LIGIGGGGGGWETATLFGWRPNILKRPGVEIKYSLFDVLTRPISPVIGPGHHNDLHFMSVSAEMN
jgi:hypothetical protein